MTKSNEVKQKNKINNLIFSLEKNGITENAVLVLIALYDLHLSLPHDEINRWLQLDDQDKRAEFLTKCYLTFRFDRKELAIQEAYKVNDIDINLIRKIMQVIATEALPSMEIAVELQDKMMSRGKISGYTSSMTNEIAELSHKIINGPEFSSEHIPGNERVAQILCAGLSAVFFALRAGNLSSIDYDLLEFRIGGASHITKLLNIAGGDVHLFGLNEYKKVVRNRLYKRGLLAEAWGAKFFRDEALHPWPDVSSEVNSLPSMMDQVNGRLICVVPSTWLSKTTAQDGSLKEYLVKNGFLEAVIQLPAGILYSTILAPALLVINTSETYSRLEILFIDASGDDFTKQVSRNYKQLTGIEKITSLLEKNAETVISGLRSAEDVLKMKCNLDVKRYVRSPASIRFDDVLVKFKTRRLGDIAKIIGCQSIKNDDNMWSRNDTVNEIGAKNIDQYGMIDDNKGYKCIKPFNKDFEMVRKQKLYADDIIIAVKGSVGKCAYIDMKNNGYIANNSFVILRLSLNASLSPFCLLHFLQSELVQAYLKQLVTGSGVPMLKTIDLKELLVPIPEKSLQAEHTVLHKKVIKLVKAKNNLEEEIEETIASFWDL